MLTIRDLIKVYPGPVAALQGIDLEVANGLFGLLGPNGAGKSTLMRIVAGLLQPTSGSVTLDGKDVVAEPEYVRARLGYLPQEFGFYPHLTGRAMLAHLLRLKGVRAPQGLRRLAEELFARVNLEWAAGRKVKEYSGGMRQRLGVAQALAGDPRILIVDEPTAGLDPEERLRFYHLLAELAQNRIVLLSTHIVEDVAMLCPRFAVIREGRLLAVTTPSAALVGVRGRIFEGRPANGEEERVRREHVVTQALLFEGRTRMRILCGDGPPPPGFTPAAETLEDAYLDLMRADGAPKAAPGEERR
ncbi:MAG: ABC transporter ATP-binding protein [Planctomycetota bacterium]